MATFDEQKEVSPTWGDPDKMQCKRCGQYGRCSLNIYVRGRDGRMHHAALAAVCLYCNEGKGRLEGLFTGTPSHPDYSCRRAQLPPGCTVSMLHQALLTHPLRRVWEETELLEFKRGLYD